MVLVVGMKPLIAETNVTLQKGDLVIAAETESDLTKGRVYSVIDIPETKDCIWIKNDRQEIESYTSDFFHLYEGECVIL